MTVAVFVRSSTKWAFRHKTAYWDDVVLEVAGEEPPPDPERGKPRVDHVRTYVRLPPDADASWARAVVDGTWDEKRYTIGGKADDAGVGDLGERNVIAVNPERWEGGLGAFFEEHYPGVRY